MPTCRPATGRTRWRIRRIRRTSAADGFCCNRRPWRHSCKKSSPDCKRVQYTRRSLRPLRPSVDDGYLDRRLLVDLATTCATSGRRLVDRRGRPNRLSERVSTKLYDTPLLGLYQDALLSHSADNLYAAPDVRHARGARFSLERRQSFWRTRAKHRRDAGRNPDAVCVAVSTPDRTFDRCAHGDRRRLYALDWASSAGARGSQSRAMAGRTTGTVVPSTTRK